MRLVERRVLFIQTLLAKIRIKIACLRKQNWDDISTRSRRKSRFEMSSPIKTLFSEAGNLRIFPQYLYKKDTPSPSVQLWKIYSIVPSPAPGKDSEKQF